MSYCRFLDADIYLFFSCDNVYECCGCRLAPLVKTIFTEGEDSSIFGKVKPCGECKGKGCKGCMMHGSSTMKTTDDCIKHVEDHIAAGDYVPPSVLEGLKEERDNPALKT